MGERGKIGKRGKMGEQGKRPFWYRDDSRAIVLTAAEAEIMRVIWDEGGPITVRKVYETLRDRKRIAYTTVMSVMNKLAKKGILTQDKQATAYIYSAAASDTEVAGGVMDAIVEKVLGGVSEPLISRLLGPGAKLSEEQVQRLEKILEENRRRK